MVANGTFSDLTASSNDRSAPKAVSRNFARGTASHSETTKRESGLIADLVEQGALPLKSSGASASDLDSMPGDDVVDTLRRHLALALQMAIRRGHAPPLEKLRVRRSQANRWSVFCKMRNLA